MLPCRLIATICKYYVLIIFFTGILHAQIAELPVYKDKNRDIEERIEDLLSRMTFEEKVEQVSGNGFETKGNVRLGIPKIIMFDEMAEQKAKRHTVNFSCEINWAATFDEELIQQVGVLQGEEARALGANMMLDPCINIARVPHGGRAFEAFGEDPYLVSRMTVAYVKGVQSQRVIACPKHFVVNNHEWNRFSVDVQVDDRTLREIYFPAYKAAIQEADALSLMTAYNQALGYWCGENKYLLTDVLRQDWGFTGFAVSDWGGTHSTIPTALAGLDLEMPAGRFMGKDLLEAVKNGQVPESVVETKVRNIMRAMFKIGLFDEDVSSYGGFVNTPARRNLARAVSQKSIVLLKNENNFLPLKMGAIKTIAVIGPNAAEAQVTGGGSGAYYGYYQISPLDGIKQKAGDQVNIKYERGIPEQLKQLSIAGEEYYQLPDGNAGIYAEYFNNRDLEGDPVLTRIEKTINFDWGYGPIRSGNTPGSPQPGVVNIDRFSARWTGKFLSPGDGFYNIGVQADNGVRLYLDDRMVIDSWTDSAPGVFKIATFKFESGRKYDIKVEFYENWGSCRCILGLDKYNPGNSSEKAVNLAAESDAVILCMGLNEDMEGEAMDRADLALPQNQRELIKAITAVNKNTVVVLNNATPILMNEWIDSVPAIIDALYPGQEGGNALADILFGDINPSGRLPFTFPNRWEDSPVYDTYPGERDVSYYKEGIFVGYRHFDKQNIEPLFPFGFGLSYTTFEYSDIEISPENIAQEDTVTVAVTIKNTGTLPGDEVAQLYVHDVNASVEREVKSLKGFKRVSLKPGESKTVSFKLDKSHLAFYDVKSKKWVAEPGTFTALVGSSSRHIRLQKDLMLKNK